MDGIGIALDGMRHVRMLHFCIDELKAHGKEVALDLFVDVPRLGGAVLRLLELRHQRVDGRQLGDELAGRDRVRHLRVEDVEVVRDLRGAVGNVLNFARHLFQVEVEVD